MLQPASFGVLVETLAGVSFPFGLWSGELTRSVGHPNERAERMNETPVTRFVPLFMIGSVGGVTFATRHMRPCRAVLAGPFVRWRTLARRNESDCPIRIASKGNPGRSPGTAGTLTY